MSPAGTWLMQLVLSLPVDVCLCTAIIISWRTGSTLQPVTPASVWRRECAEALTGWGSWRSATVASKRSTPPTATTSQVSFPIPFLPSPAAVQGVGVLPQFFCVFIRTVSAKTDAARITKRDVKMFHDESWKPVYLEVGRIKGQGHESQTIAGVGLCTLVSAGFF